MAEFQKTAVLGAGVIGASWTALILASGRDVGVYDIADNSEETVRACIEKAWPAMTALALTERGNPDALTFHDWPVDAVDRAAFVQESVLERHPIKHALYPRVFIAGGTISPIRVLMEKLQDVGKGERG